jgi:hypothetical protein
VVTHPIATGQAVDAALLAAPIVIERDHRVRMTVRNRDAVEGVVTGAPLLLHPKPIKTALKQ